MTTIVSDTLSCIPTKEAKELGIPFLPQLIIFGDKTYCDDYEIDPPGFLKKLSESSVMPKTAAPEPIRYQPIFEEFSAKNETILVICPPAKVSGTVRSAETAALDFPKADIRIVDTGLIAAGLGTVVMMAYQMAKQNIGADTIIKKVKEFSEKNRTYFLVDTLEFLRRGGRIGAASALIGGILDMKPILSFRHGQVEPVDKQRTKKRALARMVELIESECPKGEGSSLAVMHGGNIDEAVAWSNDLKQKFDLKAINISYAPPAILVHSGPGVLAASFFVS